MTEYIPVERILGPALEGNTNYQAIKSESTLHQQADREQQQREGNPTASSSATEPQSTSKMARFNWTCCKTGWFVVDGLGITCAGITYGLILYAEFVVIGVILLTDFPTSPWAYIHSLVFTFMALLAVSAHARSMTTDPVSVQFPWKPRGLNVSQAKQCHYPCGSDHDAARQQKLYMYAHNLATLSPPSSPG